MSLPSGVDIDAVESKPHEISAASKQLTWRWILVRLQRHMTERELTLGVWSMVEMSRLEWQETGKVSEVRLRNLQIGRSSEVGRFARGLSQQSQSQIGFQKIVNWVLSYVRGEPAVSYRWTGWVWEMTGWCSRLQEDYRSLCRNL